MLNSCIHINGIRFADDSADLYKRLLDDPRQSLRLTDTRISKLVGITN